MALINCKECTKEMSDTASQCPNCGAPKLNAIGLTTAQRVTAIIIILCSISLFFYGAIAAKGGNSRLLVIISCILMAYAIFQLRGKRK